MSGKEWLKEGPTSEKYKELVKAGHDQACAFLMADTGTECQCGQAYADRLADQAHDLQREKHFHD